MAETKNVEVKTKLTLDDAASGSLAKFAAGMKGVQQETKRTQGGIGDFAKQSAAIFVGTMIEPFIQKVKALGESFIHAAEADEMVSRKFAAMNMAMKGMPWDAAISSGKQLNEQFDEMAIKTGNAGESLNYAFERMSEITGDMDVAKKQLEPLAGLANAMGKNVGQLASEFGFMHEGILKTRGPLFHLLKQTGIFHENTKKAAGEWGKLTEDSRAKLLGYALEKMSARVKDIPPSMQSMVQSIKEMWEVAKETVGGPIVEEIAKAVGKIKDTFMANRAEFQKLAKTLGIQVGEWVKEAAAALEHGLTWIKDHHVEIRDAIVEGMKKAKEFVEWILSRKTELMLIFGGAAAAKGYGALKGGYDKLSAPTSVAGVEMSGAGGAAISLLALVAAIAGVELAADQANKLMVEWKGGFFAAFGDLFKAVAYGEKMIDRTADALARENAIREALAKGDTVRADQLIARMKAVGDAHAGLMEKLSGEKKETTTFKQARQMGEGYQTALRAGGQMGLGAEKHAKLVDNAAPVEGLSAVYNAAVQANDQAAQVYVANLIANSGYLTKKFLESSALISGGLEGMAKNVTESGSVAAQKFLEWAKDPINQHALPTASATGVGKPPKVSIGNATFNIKQEFRDQDPDRVALVFQRDITRAAINKTASGRAPFFGG